MSTPEMPETPTPPHTPAPPPHPYAHSHAPRGGGPGPRGGRTLSTAAMAFGLAALLTSGVAAFYSVAFAVVGVVLAITAITLGIIALVVKQRPLTLAVVGLSSGAFSVLVALAIGAFTLGATLVPTSPTGVNAPEGHGEASGAEHSEGAPSEPSPTVSWPANMAAGGIAFIGSAGEISTVRSDAPADNALPVTAELRDVGDGTAVNRIQVYVDYLCPYCALFEEANVDTLEDVLAEGSTVVELHPLTFLDRLSAGSYYSSRVAGTMACIADAQPDAAWDAHTALLSTEFQPEEGGSGHDNAAIISELEGKTAGLNATTRSCIEDEQFVPFSQALNDWVFANPVPHAEDPALTVTGTPLAVVNGVPYTGDPSDGSAFRAFLAEQSIPLT